MSKINELIQTLCPDGVEWKRLGDLIQLNLVNVVTPSFKIKRNDYLKEGMVAIISQEAEYISGYWNVNDNRIVDDKYVCFGDHSEHLKYIDFPFVQGADGLKIMKCVSNTLNTKYLYYSLCNEYIRQNDYARHFSKLRETSISVPPRPVQDEIVRILDEYTDLEAELEAKLSEEIELKQKQYEFYRDELLTFGDDVEWKLLKDVITDINTGLNPRKFFKVNTVDAENYYVTIREMVDGKIVFSERTDRINDEAMRLCNNRSKLDENTVLFSGTGTIGRTVVLREKPTNWDIKEGVYAIHPIVSKILPDYLGYILHASYVVSKYMSLAVGGTVNSVPMRELKNIEIPVPSLTEQERIVKILDKYDTYIRDMISTLNTELESRKKQYAYYRDQLLTFKRKE